MSRVGGWLLAALLLPLLLACGPDAGPLATPGPGEPPQAAGGGIRQEDPIPGATLTASGGATQAATIGAYCWNFGSDAIECMDPLALYAPPDPLRLQPGETVTFTLPDIAPLMLVTLRVLAWQPTGETATQAGIPVAPDAALLAAGDLEAAPSIPWEAPPQPGSYLLDMMATFQGGGHIAYAWQVVVE